MPIGRVAALALLAGMLLGPGEAAAVCNVTNACRFSDLAACCGSTSCVLDGTVTVPPHSVCDFDFGTRNVTLTGRLVVGSNTLAGPNIVRIEAGSLRLAGGAILATGDVDTPGGMVMVTTTGKAPVAFSLEGGAATQIDLSGGSTDGGGALVVNADGPVSLTSGFIFADGMRGAPDADGGTVLIDTSAGNVTVGVLVSARSLADSKDLSSGSGGTVSIRAAGDLTISRNLLVDGYGFGSVDLQAGGRITLTDASSVTANSGAGDLINGGDISVEGAAIDALGAMEVRGGPPFNENSTGGDGGTIQLAARTGPLQVRHVGWGLVADGGSGGSGGVIELETRSLTDPNANPPTDGTITLAAPISAEGRGITDEPGGGGSFTVRAAGALNVSSVIFADSDGAGDGDIDLSAQRDLTIGATIAVSDPDGVVNVTLASDHDVIVRANVFAKSVMGSGFITMAASNDLRVEAGKIDASGTGGRVDLEAGRHASVANGASVIADGGEIVIQGGSALAAGILGPDLSGNLTIGGFLSATTRDSQGTTVALQGCAVDFQSTAVLDAGGTPGNLVTVTARSSVAVRGPIVSSGTNTLTYPSGTSLANITGRITPAFVQDPRPRCSALNVPAGCLVPCPTCGNGGPLEFPETCDPGPGGSRCLSHCTPGCRIESCLTTNPCQPVSCDVLGGCFTNQAPDGTSCADSDKCNGDEVCSGSVCQRSAPPDCTDGNPCANTCDPLLGCVHRDQNGPVPGCDNQNRCTGAETCSAGTCQRGTPQVCPAGEVCVSTGEPPCVAKLCTGPEECGDGNPCTLDTCAQGVCTSTKVPNGTSCADSDVCNGDETCQDGACRRGTPLGDCNDGDPCTTDHCDSLLGCQHVAVAHCCNTANDCSGHNACTDCVDNSCTNKPDCCTIDADCDDHEACTVDTCDGGNHCAHSPVPDGRRCGTTCAPGTCHSGACQLGTAVSCDDANPCTLDTCDLNGDPAAPCVHSPVEECCRVGAECNDDNACTVDACDTEVNRCTHSPLHPDCTTCARDTDCDPEQRGRCAGRACGADGTCTNVAPPDCNDSNPNTRDVCVLTSTEAPQCQHQCLNDAACNDQNRCNGEERCVVSTGACAPGTALECNDHDACTDFHCDAAQGCVYEDRPPFPRTTCQLGVISGAVNQAGSADLNKAVRKKIVRLMGTIQKRLAAAQKAANAGKTKPENRALGQITSLLAQFQSLIGKAEAQHKVSGPLVDVLVHGTDQATAAIDQQRASLTP